jgi:hypothetical protein
MTHLRVNEGYNTALRDNNIAEEFVQSEKKDNLVHFELGVKKCLRRTLHHSGLQVADDEGQYVASCYHGRHYLQAPESPQPSTRERLQDRLKKRRVRCRSEYKNATN